MTRARNHVRPVGAGGELAAQAGPEAERAAPPTAPTISDVWAVRGAHCSAFQATPGVTEVQVDLQREVGGNDLMIDVVMGGIGEDGRTWHAKDSMTIPARCIDALLAALAGAHAEGTRNGMFPQAAGAVS